MQTGAQPMQFIKQIPIGKYPEYRDFNENKRPKLAKQVTQHQTWTVQASRVKRYILQKKN